MGRRVAQERVEMDAEMEQRVAEARKEARNDALNEARIEMERQMAQQRIAHGTAFVCRDRAARGRRLVRARVTLRRCGGFVRLGR